METVKKGLDRTLMLASLSLFTLLVVIVVWQVVSRQVLGSPSTWSEEGARYTFVWLGFFATALVFGERGHIAVDFAVRRTPYAVQRVMGVVIQLAILVFAGLVLIWGGWDISQQAWNQRLSSLPTQVGVMYLVMPITGVLIAFYAVYHLLAGWREQEEPAAADGTPDAATM